jgi:large repetitive protein
VSCTGAVDCTAVGGDNNNEPIAATESDGTWSTPTAISTPGDGGGFTSVSCTGPGDCTAVGTNPSLMMTATESGGTWGVATQIPEAIENVAVSCTSIGNCVAVGRNINEWPFYVIDSGGTWGTPTAIRPQGEGGEFSGVSCTGVGDCTAVGGDGNGEPAYASVVAPPGQAPTITSPASAATGMRLPFSFTVTTTGYPAAEITKQGGLPTGVTFTDNGNGTATLAGTAAAGTAGSYPINLTASNGVGTPATQSFTLTVTKASSAPAITSAPAATETFGVPFSFPVTTTGYPAPKISRTGALPPGVTLTDNGDGTATISGTPSRAAVGVYPVTLITRNSAGTATQAFTLTVTKAPVLKSIPPTAINVGTPLNLTITARGYSTPAFTESGALPTGLGFIDNGNGTATIAGTPAPDSGGRYQITVTATNQLGTTSQAFTLQVDQPPAITSPGMATAVTGNSFSLEVTATGFPAPKIAEAGKLPKGLTFHTGTATLSGTPKTGTNGSYPISFTATDNSGASEQNFTLTVTSG